MLRKKFLLIPIIALLSAMFVAPSFALPESAVPVTITRTTTGVLNAGDYWVTDGGIIQMRDCVYTGKAKLYITSSPPATPDYALTERREFSGTVNQGSDKDIAFPGPWPDAKVQWSEHVVWQFVVNGQVLGAFEGVWKLTSVGWYLTPTPHDGPSEGHAVLQGSGIFEGQTLLLDYGNSVFTGYLLTH